MDFTITLNLSTSKDNFCKQKRRNPNYFLLSMEFACVDHLGTDIKNVILVEGWN